jgi:SAM-dependent methyltransferase
MSLTTPITRCRLCENTDLTEVLALAPTPAGDHYLPADLHPERLPVFPLSLRQCSECGHVQLGAIVDPEYIYRDYIYTTKSSIGLAEHFQEYAQKTLTDLKLKPGALVVEIGSNDGTMLRAFQNLGMRVLGIDPAIDIAQKATQSGITTIPDFFRNEIADQILAEHGPAQLIIANNVLANVSSPKDTVAAIRRLLAPDGVFVFETGYLKYLAEDCVFDNIYHEHIDYYAIRPLVRFFKSLDMSMIDVHLSASKGSSIRCFVSLSEAGHAVSSTVEELCEREKDYQYQTPIPYKALAIKLESIKSKLHEILKPAKARGETIAGFGASVGVTTMLYFFELEPYISFLIDDNPSRQGLFSPGLAIPVRSPDILCQEDRPYIVSLLAWRYSELIMKKYSYHRGNGIHFLRVLPQVGLIE